MAGITRRGAARTVGTATVAAVLVGVTGTAAYSAASAYANWTLSGGAGTMTIPVTGFPSSTFTTNSTSPAFQSGKSIYLSANTPFGGVFGSSQGMQYPLLRTAPGLAPSTTTFTFRTPAPAGWGFTLGDIDADQVAISATDAAGGTVSPADLGYQSSFNFCAVSPRPQGCGTGPFTDTPVWNQATQTLTGNGADTTGGAAWFRPATPIKTLTFTFSRLSGSPVYQVWFAATSATVRGNVTVPGGAPPRTALRLLNGDGSPVLNAQGQPVITTTGARGSYVFSGIARGDYLVEMVPPRGFAADGPARRTAGTAGGDVAGVDFALRENVSPPRADDLAERDQEDQSEAISLEGAGSGDGIRVTGVSQPAAGSVTLDQSSGIATYTPPSGFTGADTFSYTLTDVYGVSATGTVRVSVTAPRSQPAPSMPEVPVTG